IDHVAQRLGPPMASFSGARHRAFVVPDREGPTWLADAATQAAWLADHFRCEYGNEMKEA
ncbi:MAG: hypothetical protein R6W93_00030, partial [Candidatus Limnocylindrales bacterium]